MLDHGALAPGDTGELAAHRHRLRHSAAHVMADAVLKLFPEAKMGIGPAHPGRILLRFRGFPPLYPGRSGANRSPDAGSRRRRLSL